MGQTFNKTISTWKRFQFETEKKLYLVRIDEIGTKKYHKFECNIGVKKETM